MESLKQSSIGRLLEIKQFRLLEVQGRLGRTVGVSLKSSSRGCWSLKGARENQELVAPSELSHDELLLGRRVCFSERITSNGIQLYPIRTTRARKFTRNRDLSRVERRARVATLLRSKTPPRGPAIWLGVSKSRNLRNQVYGTEGREKTKESGTNDSYNASTQASQTTTFGIAFVRSIGGRGKSLGSPFHLR